MWYLPLSQYFLDRFQRFLKSVVYDYRMTRWTIANEARITHATYPLPLRRIVVVYLSSSRCAPMSTAFLICCRMTFPEHGGIHERLWSRKGCHLPKQIQNATRLLDECRFTSQFLTSILLVFQEEILRHMTAFDLGNWSTLDLVPSPIVIVLDVLRCSSCVSAPQL